MKRREIWILFLFFSFTAVFCRPQELRAAPYYEKKTILLIIGAGPGSGYDNLARLAAKYLPEHIPGHPKIVLENLSTGNSMVAANKIFNSTRPDGLTIATINPGLTFAQLAQANEIKFDMRKFTLLGSLSAEPTIFCVRKGLPYKTFRELQNSEEDFFIAEKGSFSQVALFTTLIKKYLKPRVTIVNYSVSPPGLILLMNKKEADGAAAAHSVFKQAIERGDIRPLLRGRYYDEETKYLPADEDMAADKVGKSIMSARSSLEEIIRLYVAPPGTPKEITDILRRAFEDVAKNQRFLADAKKSMIPIDYVPEKKIQKTIAYVLGQPKNVAEEIKKCIAF